MSPEEIKTASDFFVWVDSLGPWADWTAAQRSTRKAILKSLPEEEVYLVKRRGVDGFFIEENRLPNGVGTHASRDSVSPSGRYKLVLSGYGTKPGAWSYSRGEVFRVSDGARVADVKRNFHSFPFTWMEDHFGHDYLICGEDYQGQTFCQLDTGLVKSYIPEEALEGAGFCWAGSRLLLDGKTLLVDGCYWAFPYEYRLYDVSNPMEGWPEIVIQSPQGSLDYEEGCTIELEGDLLTFSEGEKFFKETGERKSLIEARYNEAALRKTRESKVLKTHTEDPDGGDLLKFVWTTTEELDLQYPDDGDRWGHLVDKRQVFRLQEGVFKLVDSWKSEYQIEQERLREEYSKKSEADRRRWVAEDPLHQLLTTTAKLDGQTGFYFPSLMMKENGDKNPAYLTVRARKYNPEVDSNHTATLSWGVVEGPIKVELWIRGKGNVSNPEFPRSPEGILQAWAAAEAHLAEEVK